MIYMVIYGILFRDVRMRKGKTLQCRFCTAILSLAVQNPTSFLPVVWASQIHLRAELLNC